MHDIFSGLGEKNPTHAEPVSGDYGYDYWVGKRLFGGGKG